MTKPTNSLLHRIDYPNKNAPKLVLLHGLGGTLRYWHTGLEQLKQEYHLILVDLLGFGDSAKPWQIYTREKHLNALEDCLADITDFSLMGHSLGSILALAFANRHPNRVNKLILISLPYFPCEKYAYHWMRKTTDGWLMTNMFTALVTCLVSRWVMRRFLPKLFPNYPKEILDDILKHNMMSSTTTLWHVIYNSNVFDDAITLSDKVKVLLIHSVDDDTAPFKSICKLIKLKSKWQLCRLEHGIHHPWLWQHDACITAIHQFLPIEEQQQWI